ncbi:glycoside hydrolase superfamily [Chaetomium sp. MPI-CAGE-AT-0009]|nr:glycoside hydrolase superfamily [Chaetomium sp. MPI-CAGE-AT-0009]
MKYTTAVFLPTLFLPAAAAASISGRQSSSGTATVNLAKLTGEAKFLGSGFIYGWPDNGTSADNSIPDGLVTGIKFNSNRAGGAQISARGWAYGGYAGYIDRFKSTLSNYRTTRKYNGDFLLLPHDLWGADGGASAQTPFPGDGGNWREMEAFLTQLIKDIKANNMLDGLVMDLWNEPDLEGFWARPWSQYVEYYVRATKLVRAQLPVTSISGPSMANIPSTDNANWKAWMAAVAGNQTVPDLYAWHQIGSWSREPDTIIPIFNSMRQTYNLPERKIDINEYAYRDEQNPAASAWYLAQLERHNLRGLRANWGGGQALHDYMANLVYRKNGRYYPNGEWQLYKYYAGMTGNRVATTASSDLKFDVFATTSGGKVKIIAGTRSAQRAYTIKISGFSSLGRPASGSVNVRTYRFDWAGPEGEVTAPVDLGTRMYTYSGDTLNINMNPPTNSTAFAYEF